MEPSLKRGNALLHKTWCYSLLRFAVEKKKRSTTLSHIKCKVEEKNILLAFFQSVGFQEKILHLHLKYVGIWVKIAFEMEGLSWFLNKNIWILLFPGWLFQSILVTFLIFLATFFDQFGLFWTDFWHFRPLTILILFAILAIFEHFCVLVSYFVTILLCFSTFSLIFGHIRPCTTLKSKWIVDEKVPTCGAIRHKFVFGYLQESEMG